MSDQTQTGTGTAITKSPRIPGGDELFAQLMGAIEPDLILPDEEREAQYVEESKEEGVVRLQRYSAAIAEYKVQYEKYQIEQASDIRSFGNNLLQEFEDDDQKKDSKHMDSLEAQIASF